MNDDKTALRAKVRSLLREMPASERISASESLVTQIERSGIWQAARCILLFYPLPGEPDLRMLWNSSKLICLPRMQGDELLVHEIKSVDQLKAKPVLDDFPPVAAKDLDLVLVPGLAFTREGIRLGRGGGHFDRFLAGISATKAGVCFAAQLLPSIPREPHDVIMDHVFVSS